MYSDVRDDLSDTLDKPINSRKGYSTYHTESGYYRAANKAGKRGEPLDKWRQRKRLDGYVDERRLNSAYQQGRIERGRHRVTREDLTRTRQKLNQYDLDNYGQYPEGDNFYDPEKVPVKSRYPGAQL